MLTNTLRPLFCLTAFAVALCASPAYSQEAAPTVVKDYDVFVELPTAFAFIKLPMGWKFIGKLDADQLRRLPAGTLTSLLPPEPDSARLASERQDAAAKGS